MAGLTRLAVDFTECIESFAELEHLIPEDDPLSIKITSDQRKLYLEKYESQEAPDWEIFGLKSQACYSKTAHNTRADPALRINAASVAARFAYEIQGNHTLPRDFICVSLQLLPEAVLLHESRLAQLRFVQKFHYLPSSAAALSIAAGDSAMVALNWFESCRATIWDRFLGLKTPLDSLDGVNPELADNFQSLQRRLLSQVAAMNSPAALTNPGSILPRDKQQMQRQKDVEDYRKLLTEIRNINGMSNFLEFPQDSTKLQSIAQRAPIVPAGKPRVLWISTGLASIFSFHAAGNYAKTNDADEAACVHDLVVSVYTTSLKAFSFVREHATQLSLALPTADSQKGIIISMKSTPGLDRDHDLNVEGERKAFEKHIKLLMAVEHLPTPGFTKVKSALKSCTIAHFECHASADNIDPSKSALLLQDCLGVDGLVKDPPTFCVRTLMSLDLQRCQLAYLSACETGTMGDIRLRDEGIHLAGGFHMAGVPHVVSTLWRVDNTISVSLTDQFYKYLKSFGKNWTLKTRRMLSTWQLES
ncbi:MAG: hypothetical protein M1829_001678 [Trizodia sp. TS-e1964]|nr:MAG: hypothetical protein M1829_001678 [Trizodia sp. TS-e1964]